MFGAGVNIDYMLKKKDKELSIVTGGVSNNLNYMKHAAWSMSDYMNKQSAILNSRSAQLTSSTTTLTVR